MTSTAELPDVVERMLGYQMPAAEISINEYSELVCFNWKTKKMKSKLPIVKVTAQNANCFFSLIHINVFRHVVG